MDSLQQCVPELAPVVLNYSGLKSEMTAWTRMRQMVPNMASVTGLRENPFALTSLEIHSSQMPLVNCIVKVSVGLSSFDGLFCGTLVNRAHPYIMGHVVSTQNFTRTRCL